MERKRVYSALQPTGQLTIGNYIGAVRNMVKLQDEYDCYYSVADLHSITVDVRPEVLRENCYSLYALLLAFGLKRSTLFVQSHVPEHSQLTWVLNCHTYMGEAKRMTQFKDKSIKYASNVNVGLFDYPVLMAADILLYGAHSVPIGRDQRQHVELSRTIAERFNAKYGKTFEIPNPIFPKFGAKINSLSEPSAKMSKTNDANGTIFILDSDDDIMRKFRRAVTDSGQEIRYDTATKPGISNLLTIYSAFVGKSVASAELDFDGLNYGQFKTRVAEAVIEGLKLVKREYVKLNRERAYLESIMQKNLEKAKEVAAATMKKVNETVGFIQI